MGVLGCGQRCRVGRRGGRAAAGGARHGRAVQPNVVDGGVHGAAVGRADADLGGRVADRLAGAARERFLERERRDERKHVSKSMHSVHFSLTILLTSNTQVVGVVPSN